MDKEMIKQLANDVNNILLATAKPYQEKIRQLEERIKVLEAAEKKLRALESVGVDNWQGYDLAMDMLEANQ